MGDYKCFSRDFQETLSLLLLSTCTYPNFYFYFYILGIKDLPSLADYDRSQNWCNPVA